MNRAKTMPIDIYVVQVEDRMDGLYAFNTEREAQRFIEAVQRNGGGNCDLMELPLNINPEHTDALIESERDE